MLQAVQPVRPRGERAARTPSKIQWAAGGAWAAWGGDRERKASPSSLHAHGLELGVWLRRGESRSKQRRRRKVRACVWACVCVCVCVCVCMVDCYYYLIIVMMMMIMSVW